MENLRINQIRNGPWTRVIIDGVKTGLAAKVRFGRQAQIEWCSIDRLPFDLAGAEHEVVFEDLLISYGPEGRCAERPLRARMKGYFKQPYFEVSHESNSVLVTEIELGAGSPYTLEIDGENIKA